jgi:gliding motility-associated-like protein
MLKERLAILVLFLLSGADVVFCQINNYNPPLNTQVIPKGSFIIGMDNFTQSKGSLFNLKAYGLVNFLLKNNIPVKRIIKSKSNIGDTDFGVSAQLLYPAAGSASNYNFKAGPYIIDSGYVSQAAPLITQFGGSVKVYKTLANISVNIAQTLTEPSYIAVLNDGGNPDFYRAILDSAGFSSSDYNVISAADLNISSCYTFACESDNLNNNLSDTTFTNPVKRFVNSGGNFMAQYEAIAPYESKNHFLTLLGLSGVNNSSMTFKNVSHPFIQFDGTLLDAQGSFKSMLLIGGSFMPNTYSVIQDNSGPGANYKALTRKYATTSQGGHVFYLAGQPSNYEWVTNDSRSAYRIFLNAAMMPSQTLNLCMQSDIQVSAAINKMQFCSGDTLSVKLKAENLGRKAAIAINVKNSLNTGFSFLSSSQSHGSYQAAGNTWSIPALQPGASDSIVLNYSAGLSGNYTAKLFAVKDIIDFNQLNDSVNFSFLVNPPPQVNAGKDTSICYGSMLMLGEDSLPGNSYQWSSIGNAFNSLFAKPVVAASDDITYVLYQKNISTGCAATDTIQVDVNPLPLTDLGKETEICAGDSFSVSVQYNAELLCSWNSQPPGISGNSNVMKATASGQTCLYLVQTSSVTGCQSQDSIIINVSLPPSVSIAANDTSTYHLSSVLRANAATQGSGKWGIIEGGGEIEDPLQAHTRVSKLMSGKNVFRWTISSGSCEPSYDDVVILVKELLVPQGFSPNGDGVNDEFTIEGIHEFPGSNVEIFSRWGTRVFSGESYENNWRGESEHGEKLPDDTYYYVVSIPDKGVYKSYVVLKR